MAVIEIKRTVNLNGTIIPEYLAGPLYGGEKLAHKFIISAVQGNAPVQLSGTVSGLFIREADGQTVPLVGSIEGGKATVTLLPNCYYLPGRFTLTIFVASGGANTAVYSANGSVRRTETDSAVDPSGEISLNVAELIQGIADAVATIPADYSELQRDVYTINPATDYTWTLGENIDATGTRARNQYIALSQRIPCSPGDIITRTGADRDAGGNILAYYVSEFAEGEFVRRTELTAASPAVTIGDTTTDVYVAFGRHGSSGTNITQGDIDTYFGARFIRQAASAGQMREFERIKPAQPAIDWTLERMVTSAGVEQDSDYFATSGDIDVNPGDWFYTTAPKSDGTNYFVLYVAEYGDTGFVKRTELTGNTLHNELVFGETTTRVKLSFGRYASSGVQITQADVDTYAAGNMVFERRLISAAEVRGMLRKNQTVALFGDSIMWGASPSGRTPYGIPYWIARETGCEVINYGVSGQGWIGKRDGKNAVDNIKAADLTGVDVVVMEYGANDSNYSLGEYTDTEQDVTIMGSIYTAVAYLAQTYPTARLVLVATPNTVNYGTAPRWRMGSVMPGGYTGQDMADEYKKFADWYGIQYIDFQNGPINGLVAENYFYDRLHPTEDGYRMFGKYLAARIFGM